MQFLKQKSTYRIGHFKLKVQRRDSSQVIYRSKNINKIQIKPGINIKMLTQGEDRHETQQIKEKNSQL